MIIGNAPTTSGFAGSAGQILSGTIQENLFIQGKSFSWEGRIIFGNDEVKIIVLDRSLYLGPQLVFNPVISGASSGPVFVDLYTNIAYTKQGDQLFASNRREGMPQPKSQLWLEAPADVTLGLKVSDDTVFASGVGAGNTNPGSNILGIPFEPTTNKALRVENTDGAGTIVQFKMTWFEV